MILYGIKNCHTVKVALEWMRRNSKENKNEDNVRVAPIYVSLSV